MKNSLKLDEEEVKILLDFERGELTSANNFKEAKRQLEVAAREFLQKDKRINIRISSRDLNSLQKKAAKEAMPTKPSFPAPPQIRNGETEKYRVMDQIKPPSPLRSSST